MFYSEFYVNQITIVTGLQSFHENIRLRQISIKLSDISRFQSQTLGRDPRESISIPVLLLIIQVCMGKKGASSFIVLMGNLLRLLNERMALYTKFLTPQSVFSCSMYLYC